MHVAHHAVKAVFESFFSRPHLLSILFIRWRGENFGVCAVCTSAKDCSQECENSRLICAGIVSSLVTNGSIKQSSHFGLIVIFHVVVDGDAGDQVQNLDVLWPRILLKLYLRVLILGFSNWQGSGLVLRANLSNMEHILDLVHPPSAEIYTCPVI